MVRLKSWIGRIHGVLIGRNLSLTHLLRHGDPQRRRHLDRPCCCCLNPSRFLGILSWKVGIRPGCPIFQLGLFHLVDNLEEHFEIGREPTDSQVSPSKLISSCGLIRRSTIPSLQRGHVGEFILGSFLTKPHGCQTRWWGHIRRSGLVCAWRLDGC